MAHKAGEQFPVLCEVGGVRIRKNPSNELFISDIESGVTIRLNASRGGLEFTTDDLVQPVRVSNMIGWRIE